MKQIKRNFPNALTCLNLLCGVMAIICGVHGASPLWGLRGVEWGWIFIGCAAIADFLDGFAARLLGAYSDMGKELDSLCDNVSFGVAPALNLFYLIDDVTPGAWYKWCVLLIPVCGALRLARFNTDGNQSTIFTGLPIPANAIFWIGYMAMVMEAPDAMTAPGLLIPVIIVESWLMVSPIRMFSLKMKGLGWKGHQPQWIIIVAALFFVFSMQVAGLLWLIILYVCMSVVFTVKARQ